MCKKKTVTDCLFLNVVFFLHFTFQNPVIVSFIYYRYMLSLYIIVNDPSEKQFTVSMHKSEGYVLDIFWKQENTGSFAMQAEITNKHMEGTTVRSKFLVRLRNLVFPEV